MVSWLERAIQRLGGDATIQDAVRAAQADAAQREREIAEARARLDALHAKAQELIDQGMCIADTFKPGPVQSGLVMFGESSNSTLEKNALRQTTGGKVVIAEFQPDYAKKSCLTSWQATDLGSSGSVALAPLFAEAQNGKRKIDRLAISGHGGVNGPFAFSLDDAERLAKQFPKADDQVEHLMLAACHSNHPASYKRWKAIFPNLKTLAGYDRSAPSGSRAVKQLQQWDQATRLGGSALPGLDPEVTTWTSTRGFRGTLPPDSMDSLDSTLRLQQPVYDRYKYGNKPLTDAPNDRELTDYYALLQRLAQHKDATEYERKRYSDLATEVLSWRHPELVVTH